MEDLGETQNPQKRTLPRMPSEIPAGVLCNDGCLSFTVPSGWMATRSLDSFCLSHLNGRSRGFVRAVPAAHAADALLDTDRLEVILPVHAFNSPTLERDIDYEYAVVPYAVSMGAGKG